MQHNNKGYTILNWNEFVLLFIYKVMRNFVEIFQLDYMVIITVAIYIEGYRYVWNVLTLIVIFLNNMEIIKKKEWLYPFNHSFGLSEEVFISEVLGSKY